MSRLTTLQIDALKEIANIGAGHAATALSHLLDSIVRLEAPKAELVGYEELDAILGQGNVFAALDVDLHGDIPGHLVMFFDRQDAFEFVRLYLQRISGEVRLLDAVVENTLKEFGNVVASSYLGALAQLTGANVVPSLPAITYGSMRATLEALLPPSACRDVFFVESTFTDRGKRICGHVVFVPDTGSLQPLFKAFGL